MRWTPKRTLPIVKPSLEHRYKQREIKTGRKPDDRQEREAAPHGAVSLLVLHNNEERLFAKIRSFRKGFLTGAADHLRIGDTGTARFGTTSRQKNGPACSGPQLGSSYPFRGITRQLQQEQAPCRELQRKNHISASRDNQRTLRERTRQQPRQPLLQQQVCSHCLHTIPSRRRQPQR